LFTLFLTVQLLLDRRPEIYPPVHNGWTGLYTKLRALVHHQTYKECGCWAVLYKRYTYGQG